MVVGNEALGCVTSPFVVNALEYHALGSYTKSAFVFIALLALKADLCLL
jgi:hypothetical protein